LKVKPREHNINLLYRCIRSTLARAVELKCKTVSIPAISSGIFGFPKPLCAKVLFKAVEDFVCENDKDTVPLTKVRFTNFDSETTIIFQKEFISRYAAMVKEQ
jgi:O-acetyl-ADP-ribose deacetylase (regulator of RNase III)